MSTKKKRRNGPDRTDYCTADRLETKGRRYYSATDRAWTTFADCSMWSDRKGAVRWARRQLRQLIPCIGHVIDTRTVPLSPRTKASKKRTR